MPDSWAYDIGTIRSYLLAAPEVSAFVGTRIFGDELPNAESNSMPRKCVVINSAGGREIGDMLVSYRTKDLKCYGETPYEASRLWGAVDRALRAIRQQMVTPAGGLGQVKIYSASRVSGPIMLREPDSNWPLVFGTYSVLIADEV